MDIRLCSDCGVFLSASSKLSTKRCRSCAAKYRWSNPKYAEKCKAARLPIYSDPNYKTKLSQSAKAAAENNDLRKLRSDIARAREANELLRARRSSVTISQWANPELRSRMLDGILKASARSKYEHDIKECLVLSGLRVIPQYRPANYHRIYDFYIPELQLFIEADGEYWHHSAWAICKGQELVDEEKSKWALTNGYSIIRLRECYSIQYGIQSMVDSALSKFLACIKRPVGLKYIGAAGPML